MRRRDRARRWQRLRRSASQSQSAVVGAEPRPVESTPCPRPPARRPPPRDAPRGRRPPRGAGVRRSVGQSGRELHQHDDVSSGPSAKGRTHDPAHPDRHRHRRDVHRRRRVRRGHRRAGHHQDPVDAEQPGRRLPRRHRQGPRPARRDRRRHRRGQPRHHGRDQPAARGQGRPARLHHHRGLRGDARDRPAVGARRLRQLLLLGEARPDRAARPGQGRRGPARLHRRGGAPVRRGRRPRGRPLVQGAGHHHPRRLLPARLRQPRARGADARGARRGAPRRRRVALQRGAARVPRVRAGDDHARRRGREASALGVRHQHQDPADGRSTTGPSRST